MPYFDRLQTGTYISPSGDEFEFSFEALQRDINHKIGSFEFSGIQGTLHQDKGVSGEIYPLRIFFHGSDYDITADRFLESLKQIGSGFLVHPRWGRRRVQVLSINQSENFTEQAGQSVFTVTFQETLEREFPKTGTAPKQALNSLKSDYKTEAVSNYSNIVETENFADKLALQQDIAASGNLIKDSLSFVASLDEDVFSEFNEYVNDIINNASDYVDDPLSYASNVVDSILLVSEIPGRIASKLLGYTAMIDSITSKVFSIPSIQNRNKIIIDELLGTSALVSASDSINNNISNSSSVSRNDRGRSVVTIPEGGTGFSSREEILTAILYLQNNSNDLIAKFDTSQELFDDNVLSESYLQTVSSYVPTWTIVSTVIKSGLEASFSLPIKRIVRTTNDRTILDICAEYYQNIDDSVLDYFISTNKLKGQDIILVPKGTDIIYYV